MLQRGWRAMRFKKGKYLGIGGESEERERDGYRVVDLSASLPTLRRQAARRV